MKTRIIIVVLLLLMLTVLLSRNDDYISDSLLAVINPIKQSYKNFTQEVEDKSHSYIFQKESIEKLSRENRILRKRLLEQVHYIKQVKNIYEVLPDLSRLPIANISITETISYVKLNSFSQIILTKPKGLQEDTLYGLMQGKVVAGTAKVHNNQLYGYLTSDKNCRFSVFIGKDKAPGIAIGREKNEMLIKFIPKWHKIHVGDPVITSGLDGIFFADIPLGVVKKIEVQSSYTVAYIKTYSDIFHPKTFFLINDAKATLAEGFDSNTSQISAQYSIPNTKTKEINISEIPNIKDKNMSQALVSSIPSRIDQTLPDVAQPSIPPEIADIIPKKVKKIKKNRKVKRKKRRKKSKVRRKRRPKSSSLDLF